MPLRFPNARLHMHNLLADDSMSGPDAITRTALDYGLVEPDFLNSSADGGEKHDCCLQAARSVMDKYFASRANDTIDLDLVWASLLKEANRYLSKSARNDGEHIDMQCLSLPVPREIIGNTGSNRSEGNGCAKTNGAELIRSCKQTGQLDSMTQHNCNTFAPVVFDLLLQEIRRYP